MYFTGIRDMVNLLTYDSVMYFTGIRDMVNLMTVISKLTMSLIPVKYMT